ncbi:MAG: asparagine synthase (glutamine-hydrolyzing) [Chromatiales bacterium]|nr:asparagine synthase (glutamine-hydrolyzing) [Chromatiales bacterium]
MVGTLARDIDGAREQQILRTLAHRGPDASAVWRGNGVLLFHTRLSIRDLTPSGAQPMTSASGRSTIAYNGEIYDFSRLQDGLRASGLRFRGTSDTEVVLEHLERLGSGGLRNLNGMFGLAHWDSHRRQLMLARDATGIKPLYYAHLQGSLVFASELKALLAIHGVDRALDPTALGHYLSLGFVPAPWTIVRGVRQLLPGHALLYTAGGEPEIQPYSPPIGSNPEATVAVGENEALEQLTELLLRAAGDQLLADVPVGVLLSGGVDSSLVAAAAARRTGRLRTFTVIHDDPRYDEREPARAVASSIGSDHVEVEMPGNGLTQDELEGLVDHHGDPFADSSSLPMRRLAREVRKHVKVALSGDGGDELFCGYPRYAIGNLVHRLAGYPRPLLSTAGGALRAATRISPGAALRSQLRRAARAFALAGRPAAERAIGTITFFWPEEQARLLRREYAPGLEDLSRLVLDRAPRNVDPDAADGCHRMEQHLVLPDDMLVKVDRMTMAESLEIRPVLLDQRLSAFAAKLPMRHKLHDGQGKYLLRKLARSWLPPWTVDRPKMGFAVPLLDFGGQTLQDATRWALESTASPAHAIFTKPALASLATEFARRGDGVSPEDSAFRRAQRQWAVVVLSLALSRMGVSV